jgi:hypothetical protein
MQDLALDLRVPCPQQFSSQSRLFSQKVYIKNSEKCDKEFGTIFFNKYLYFLNFILYRFFIDSCLLFP